MASPRPGTTGPAWRRRAADVPLDRLLAPQEHASTWRAVDAGFASRRRFSSEGTRTSGFDPCCRSCLKLTCNSRGDSHS